MTRSNATYELVIAAILLAGCGPVPEPTYQVDQCMRRTIFKECMAALPKGPERVATSNDWDEVVGACDNAARYQAIRGKGHIKEECRVP